MFADVATVWGSWAQVVLALVAVGGVLFAFFRWLDKHVAGPLQEVPVIRATQLKTSADVTAMRSDISALQEQMVPNHGSSLRDSNDRTEVLIRAVADRVGVDAEAIVNDQNPPDQGVR